jgi:hypothetical protein
MGTSRRGAELVSRLGGQSDRRHVEPKLRLRTSAAYTSGEDLAYVVIKDEKGEQVYRYGDASRLTAKREDSRGYMLFTCASLRVFLPLFGGTHKSGRPT